MGEGTERRWEEGLGEEKGMKAVVGLYIHTHKSHVGTNPVISALNLNNLVNLLSVLF